MEVKLYSRDVSLATLLEELTGRVLPVYSTRLHGGFHRCRFVVKANQADAWRWSTERIGCRLQVTDKTQLLWEGRIEDVEPDYLRQQVEVTAYGYYANLSDVPYATAYNDVFSVVIKAVLTACCVQVNSDQSNIDATDITITSAAGEEYLDTYPQQIVEKLGGFSDSTNGVWYFAIWDDRKPHLHKRSVSSIDWRGSLQGGDFEQFRPRYRLADLWNSVYAVYDSGGVARTATADNAASQTRYGLTRRKVIPNLGSVALAAANAARDGWLAQYADIYSRQSQIVLGRWAQDANGVRRPSSWIRAGDVFRVDDLVPVSGDLDAAAMDAYRTFFLVETEYDAARDTMRLVPDTERGGLAGLLARKV